ncbi:MAG: hypothetical protein ACYSTW_05935 [Planctomycetota bacterium]
MINKKPVTGGLQNISPKVMAMIVLLVVMGILWGRVLLKGAGGPAAAHAQDQADMEAMISNMTPEAVDHDQNSAHGGVQVGGAGDSSELTHRSRLERIAGRLKLEAVICDAQNRPFQAFVEDTILSVGSTLTVQEGPDEYVLLLEEISEKEVLFSWNEMSVVLKMAETFEF